MSEEYQNIIPTYKDFVSQKILGECFSCGAKNCGRAIFSCKGHIFSDLKYVTHLNLSGFGKEIRFILENTEKTILKTSTVAELINDNQNYHILACSEISSMYNNPKIYELFSPGTYIVAIHNDDSMFEGTMAYLPPYDCISTSSTSTANKDTLSNSEMNIYITDKNGLLKKSTILGSMTTNALKKKIKELFGDSGYNKFKLYEAKTLNYTLDRKLNEIDANCILISKTKFEKCLAKTFEQESVQLIDFTYDVKSDEKCELNGETIPDHYAIQASPCGHKFSVGGFFAHIRNGVVKQFIAENINEETKNIYPYLITCPVCIKKDVNDDRIRGGITTHAGRIHPYFYQVTTKWSTIPNFLQTGSIRCALDTHRDECSIFTPKVAPAPDVMKVCWLQILFKKTCTNKKFSR